ncbi:MAG: hypothetical protein STSR0009_01810 [Methanoregula sp.]
MTRGVGSKDPCRFLPGQEGGSLAKKRWQGVPTPGSDPEGGGGGLPDPDEPPGKFSDVNAHPEKGGGVLLRVPWWGVWLVDPMRGGGGWQAFFGW